MPATYTQFRDDLLVAVARKTNREGRNFFDYDEVADEAGLSRNEGWTEMAAFEFRDMGYTNDASSGDGFAGALNGLGMQQAERIMGAAEQTVELDHSAPEYQRATAALGAVTEAVRQSNDYASSEPEDREQRLAELEAAKGLLKPKRARLGALLAVVLPVLGWLADHFAGGVIGDLASEAIAALKALIDGLNLY
jgi:hypothetical protein